MKRYELDTWNCELEESPKGEYCKWEDVKPFVRAIEKFSTLECAFWSGATTEDPCESYCDGLCPGCLARSISERDNN